MTHDIAGIDHLLIGVRDLEAAAERYRRLGFTLTPRGRHQAKNTGNYCIMFGADYLELKGVVDPDAPDEGFLAQLAMRGEGLVGVAFAGPADDAAAARWRAAGVEASAPLALTRALELPQGPQALGFSRIRFPETAALGLDAFVCQHLTPELTRRPEWLGHANGAQGVASVTAVVDAPAAHADLIEKLLGNPGRRDVGQDLTFMAGDAAIVLRRRRASFAAERDRALPFLAGAAIRVADPAATASYLESQAVPHEVTAWGTVRVPPAEACGVALDFIKET